MKPERKSLLIRTFSARQKKSPAWRIVLPVGIGAALKTLTKSLFLFQVLRDRAPWCVACALSLAACGDEGDADDERTASGGTGTGGTLGGGGSANGAGGQGTGGQGPSATGGVSVVTGGSAAATGGEAAGTGGTELGSGGGVMGSGGAEAGTGGSSGGSAAGGSGGSEGTGGDQGSGGAGTDPSIASGFDELFLDRPCSENTSLPLETGATCDHLTTQHVEESFSFGGEAGTLYSVTLRVRGIWEPTSISGGEQANEEVPFTVGGDVAMGSGSDSDAINYQQFFIEVDSPEQSYWLNNYGYVAHDIYKEDYEVSIVVEGGSTVRVIANDGNEREIANFPQEFFSDLPPYDETPTLGQFLRLDVLAVELMP